MAIRQPQNDEPLASVDFINREFVDEPIHPIGGDALLEILFLAIALKDKIRFHGLPPVIPLLVIETVLATGQLPQGGRDGDFRNPRLHVVPRSIDFFWLLFQQLDQYGNGFGRTR